MNDPSSPFTLSSKKGTQIFERVSEFFFLACAALSVLTSVGIAIILLVESLGFFKQVPFTRLFTDTEWTPFFVEKSYGLWPLLAGTLVTAFLAMSVALPFGILSALYLAEVAAPKVKRIIKPALEILAGVPTIVYGYFALVVVTPALQKIVPGVTSFNALSAGLVMGVMIIPLISSLCEDAISRVPGDLREASLALGASNVRTMFSVILPSARSGILAASLLAFGRAIGETMIVAIAAGQQPRLSLDPRESMETMTAYIVQVSLGDTPAGSLESMTLFVIGGALFVVTFAINSLSQRIVRGKA